MLDQYISVIINNKNWIFSGLGFNQKVLSEMNVEQIKPICKSVVEYGNPPSIVKKRINRLFSTRTVAFPMKE